jgi:Mg-chelatase subunit ChlD
MRHCLIALIAAGAAVLAPFTTASAQEYPEVMFVLDASGSMSEDIGGQTKMEAAKEVMNKLVPELAPEVRVGLTVYGHRRQGDCRDIEVVVPSGSNDRDALLAKIQSLQPKGKTPISSAILTAARRLQTKDNETTIVLVSDGIETCGNDPCKVAAQLKATGAKFVIHVVGFDVGAAAARQLQCVAKATGGKYFSAGDAETLLEAMNTVSAEVTRKVETAKAKTVQAATGLGKLRVTMPKGSEISLAYLQIARVRDGKVVKTVEGPQADSTHPLLSGKYRVACGFAIPNSGNPTLTEIGEVTVVKGQTRDLQLGSISFNIPKELVDNDWKNRINVSEVILADAGSNETVVSVTSNNNGYYNYKSKPVLAGIYNVSFRYSTNTEEPAVVARNVQVSPGQETVVTLDCGIRFLVAESDIIGWHLIPRDRETAVRDEDGSSVPDPSPALEARAFSATGGGNSSLWYPYLVPPGRYDIFVHFDGMDEALPVAENIELCTGQLLRFDAGL